MTKYISIAQAVAAGLLIISILLQRREGGLGSAFGGGGGDASNQFSTRRGVENIIHYATIVLAVLFFALAIARVAIQ